MINPHFPTFRSGHRPFQRPSPGKQFPSIREIKLWFKPTDIPSLMRPYPTVISDQHYYYHNGRIFTTYKQGRILLMAPGSIVWKSDIDAMHAIREGRPAACTLESVAGKYLINEMPEST